MTAHEAMADALARTARAYGVAVIPADVVQRAHELLAIWAQPVAPSRPVVEQGGVTVGEQNDGPIRVEVYGGERPETFRGGPER